MSPHNEPTRCPYCLAALEGPERDALVSCEKCLTRHHAACFREHGRCTALGCESTRTTTDTVVQRRPGAQLHPFLSIREPGLRPASFLSVEVEERAGPLDRRRPSLRLEMPDRARCGRALEGRVEVFVPRAVHGQGIRLIAAARVRPKPDADELTVYEQEAVLRGRPARGWLERIRRWRSGGAERLLVGGTSVFRFSFDPGRLHWRGKLPKDPTFGAWHSLDLKVVIDSAALPRETRQCRVLVLHPHRFCGRPLGPETT